MLIYIKHIETSSIPVNNGSVPAPQPRLSDVSFYFAKLPKENKILMRIQWFQKSLFIKNVCLMSIMFMFYYFLTFTLLIRLNKIYTVQRKQYLWLQYKDKVDTA